MTFPEYQNILYFITAATLLIVIPGPAVLYIMAKSIEQGYKAGMISVLGIGLGGLVHVIAAGIGISAILVTSTTAFSILKYIGALYLIFLGVKKLLEKNTSQNGTNFNKNKKLTKVFYEGIMVNALNPKTAIFFFAFLPQFVTTSKGEVGSQIVFLGLLFILIATVSDFLYVLMSVRFSQWLRSSPTFLRVNKYIMAFVYVLLGLITLFIQQPSNEIEINTK
ncbi:LysE family translocator [Flagellimonas sp. CMM7]|uniref:LysE family translocator n=1 Tax=Flagellimonas sp. CMM7 TaxID=2654676 RepID=UPI0013D0CF4E|nr:LysE family translocator [Flagellimonas sp. CMM7]UII81061.1 LysE family translocator [Flagellimonas sp. CMM7]